jgi:hypothetical protein
MSIPMVNMLEKEIQSLCNFPFLKIEPTNKVQSFFCARKTSLFISFTSLIGMEQTKASLVGMDLSNMAQLLFLFFRKIFEEVFCVARIALK